ncbi:phosphoribosylformylglycinamidine cyclo-ligase [Geotalea daltonii FRC-32]|uniref:Phosphoribosylformylglycinamidine cyclo-ligase n=1 Tax=Geotalea daltonii (strain DSM 22248 / JCM 15807 / FRC-32) TaxID=316067 RepID=PUR5_GEODF|nr:phosphoribosylformylglycinamidine cyclo-ligase [Geotalea daltonii]B9M1P4.1 RecName: Full=Phosphoribosylformylglycinamidine cyclo-ligase; AltName: Full=AIR synthase; AltName: Full=AIRS; AltName: Full=Phosphoribosyl-aminoimidazole synthetase [Geotalea daltonii FRC-32]ACM21126.1 phosphoribosylformylglycinamidine cyclo-ligase [Geotalea daltonii FRC-32]
MSKARITYKDAGVDIDAGNTFVKLIKPLVKATSRPEVLADIGGFGGLFSLSSGKYKNPVLVSGTDGVGTKLKIAFLADRHDTIGIDLVAMCVNDIIVQGAEPLFFLDYLATAKLYPGKGAAIIKGVAEGCLQAGCALIGGETAEMPGFYAGDEYDMAGFTVGVVERDKIIDGSSITVGDKLIGLASSGLHSNGYSLARKVIMDVMGLGINDTIPGLDKSVADELLTPTRIYVKSILNLLRDFTIHGIAHITGGGLLENIPRILPNGCKAVVDKTTWQVPEIFKLIQNAGNIEEQEMFRTFNCGIGMVLSVPEKEVEEILIRLSGLNETAFVIGEIAKCDAGTECVEMV